MKARFSIGISFRSTVAGIGRQQAHLHRGRDPARQRGCRRRSHACPRERIAGGGHSRRQGAGGRDQQRRRRGECLHRRRASLIDADRIGSAGQLSLSVDAGGSIRLGRAEAVRLAIVGAGRLDADSPAVLSEATLAADDIRIGELAHIGGVGRLRLEVTGAGGADATRLQAHLTTPLGVEIGDYGVATSVLETSGSFVSIARGLSPIPWCSARASLTGIGLGVASTIEDRVTLELTAGRPIGERLPDGPAYTIFGRIIGKVF